MWESSLPKLLLRGSQLTVPPSIHTELRHKIQNTEKAIKYTDMDFSHVVKMADSECASCASPSGSLSSSTYFESLQALEIVNMSLLATPAVL